MAFPPGLLRSVSLFLLIWLAGCHAATPSAAPQVPGPALADSGVLPPDSPPPPPTPSLLPASATPPLPTLSSRPATATPQPSPTPDPVIRRVGLQVGHWKLEELPAELAALRKASGAYYGGYDEWEVNIVIAELLKTRLEAEGIIVDLIPATVPAGYSADAFLSLHADGITGAAARNRRGWKVATPWRASAASQQLSAAIAAVYGEITGLPPDPRGPSYDMRTYYSFADYRFTHAVAPTTPSVIVEMGFMTHPADRELLFDQPELIAAALARGLLDYLAAYDPLDTAARTPIAYPELRAASAGLALYSQPDPTAGRLIELGPDERMVVLSETADWYLVIVRDVWEIGWVARAAVRSAQ